ncbi:MAG: hypothetical protein HC794_06440 [Nitrospiraceae bacterium]|nr:hypothetical protein [Nitrospiraceae bacterium]
MPATAPLSPYFSDGNTTAASLETQEAVPTCDYNHTHSVWFTFTPATSASYLITTAGSTYDTVLAVYTGAAVNALTQIACNDDASALVFTSQLTQTLTQGITYRLQVSGYNGRYGDYVLRIQQLGVPRARRCPRHHRTAR